MAARFHAHIAALASAFVMSAHSAERIIDVTPRPASREQFGATPLTKDEETQPQKDGGAFDLKSFGGAVSVGFAPLRTRNVETATIRGNVIRIDKESNASAGLWIEAHHWFSYSNNRNRGFGPFIAIQAGSTTGGGEAIGAWALGVMYGSKSQPQTIKENVVLAVEKDNVQVGKKPDGSPAVTTATVKETSQPSASLGWNIGLAIASVKVQTLGDGLTANQALPTGITEIYYKSKRIYVPLVIVSFVF